MNYPTLEQYNETLQNPQTALIDPELKKGTIATTYLGLPLALCGGFALTYTITTASARYAVRCFHKQSNALEQRYKAISQRLKSLRSRYFLDFEFQTQGVRVNGKVFPIVKMAWASGKTLGEFLEQRYRNPMELQQLRLSLRSLSSYLENHHLAHGDIQPGNVMVANGGLSVQLIDYDGMYVDDLKALGSTELGHRNFQHPKRTSNSWDYRLDRFSFISIDLALRVLEECPELWGKTQSSGDAILFKANDFIDPRQSDIFNKLFALPKFSQDAKNFATICQSPFEKIPTLEEFITYKNIPQPVISKPPIAPLGPRPYIPPFPVLDATNYALCLQHVGDRIELIGKIVEVKTGSTRHRKPYVFVNFGPWQGKSVRISIWSEGLSALAQKPDAQKPNRSWIGKWVSVVGLMEPPYENRKYQYTHLAISITQANQLCIISELEAKFRLSSTSMISPNKNREILEGIRKKSGTLSPSKTFTQAPSSPNQAVLQTMKNTQSSNTKNDCFIATAVYGPDSPKTNALRTWRDRALAPSKLGRTFISCYYTLSPWVVPVIERNERLASIVMRMLDWLVTWVGKHP